MVRNPRRAASNVISQRTDSTNQLNSTVLYDLQAYTKFRMSTKEAGPIGGQSFFCVAFLAFSDGAPKDVRFTRLCTQLLYTSPVNLFQRWLIVHWRLWSMLQLKINAVVRHFRSICHLLFNFVEHPLMRFASWGTYAPLVALSNPEIQMAPRDDVVVKTRLEMKMRVYRLGWMLNNLTWQRHILAVVVELASERWQQWTTANSVRDAAK